MRPALLPLALTLMSAPLVAQIPTGIVTLNSLRDTARPLLVFAPKPNDPQLLIQLRRLQTNPAAVSERDVVLLVLPYHSASPTNPTLTPADAEAARRRFHITPSDFAIILLGKDGGEKLRSSHPITLDQLRNTIDAMPMRQQEMRRNP
jgi:hypothetical protein